MDADLTETSDENFVEYCYLQLLGRPSDLDGKLHWLKLLNAGQISRLRLVEGFVSSSEFQNRLNSPFVRFAPPGHFYSPLPAIEDVAQYELRVAQARSQSYCAGVDLRPSDQIVLMKQLATFYPQQPFTEQPSGSRRYYFANDSFTYYDGLVLYCMLRRFRPRQVIEVGAGFSSAVMLDTNDLFLNGETRFTFIEPYPERLQSLLSDSDKKKIRIVKRKVQDVALDEFAGLSESDILFIDSSHVVKFASDVMYVLFEVLPSLKQGVLIHFHDVLWPFEYPKVWLLEGRAWNEDYLLRAFLSYNRSFEILCFNNFLALFHRGLLSKLMPLAMKGTGGSLWLRKAAAPEHG